MKIGLALGSGSSRGWSHIGVIEALAELGIRPAVVCGTSVGSLVGAAYAADNLETLKSWVCSLTMLNLASYFNIGGTVNGFVNGEKLRQALGRHVVASDTRIEDLPLRYAAVATELESGHERWLTEGDALSAVWASIALPAVFPPVYHQGRWLLDGGLVNPVPVSTCRALGAEVVIAVNLNGDLLGKHEARRMPVVKNDSPHFVSKVTTTVTTAVKGYASALFASGSGQEQSPGMFEAIAQSINIAQDRITRSRMAGDPPDIILAPKLAHIGLLEFYRAQEAIEEGKHCVRKMLPALEELVESA